MCVFFLQIEVNEGACTYFVYDERVGPALDEQLDGVLVAVPRGHQDGAHAVLVLRLDITTRLDQQLHDVGAAS